MYNPGAISSNHGTLPGPSKATIKANFLSMKPSDMFRMMGVLGTQTQPSSRVQTEPPPPTSDLPGYNLDFDVKPEPLGEFATIAKSQWQVGAPGSEEAIPKRIAVPVNLKPVEVVLAPQYTGVDYSTYSSISPLTKVGIMTGLPEEAPAPRYSRTDTSTLDGSLPLNLPTPHYKGFEIQTSSGKFSRKVTSYEPEIKTYSSPKVVLPVPRANEVSFSALDGMLSWNTSRATASPSAGTIPKPKVTNIPPSKGTFIKKVSSSGFQMKGVPDTKVVTPPAALYRDGTPGSTIPPSKKPAILGFGDNLEPDMQIPAPVTSRKKAEKVTKSGGNFPKELTGSGPDISSASSLEIITPTASASRSTGYSFLQDSLSQVVTKVGSKFKVKEGAVEPAILKPGIVTNNPKINRLEQMVYQCKNYITYEEKFAVSTPFQANIVSSQDRAHQERGRKVDPFARVKPIAKLSIPTPKVGVSGNAKFRNASNNTLPALSDAEESDPSHSSSDEAEEIRLSDDVTLISSKPWVKRITARRRIRQGEFSKW